MYIEILFLFNFFLDFLILMTTSILLKRNAKIFNLLVGAFIGSLSIIILFLNINSIQLLILKVYLSILMNLFTFYYKSIRYTVYNIVVFYFVSISIGGFLYFLKLYFDYKSLLFLFIICPFIIYIYIKQMKLFTNRQNKYYDVLLYIGSKCISLTGYLDSGNTLKHKGNLVIITNLKNNFSKKTILVPYKTISGTSLLECIKIKKVIINTQVFDKVLLGFSDNMNIEGAEVLLNKEMEDIIC